MPNRQISVLADVQKHSVERHHDRIGDFTSDEMIADAMSLTVLVATNPAAFGLDPKAIFA